MGEKIKINKNKIIKGIILIVVLTVVYFALAYAMDPKIKIIPKFYSRILQVALINTILALSLNLVLGITGQLSMGHAGFMAIGAYASALMSVKVGAPFVVGMIVGGIVAAIIATIIGLPILRLKGDYLAICTLGFGEIVVSLLQNVEFLGGARGLSVPSNSADVSFRWVYITLILTVFIIRNLVRSSHGRAILSVREDEIAAESMGINTTKYKVLSFAIAAFLAGVAGALFAHFQGFIEPKAFNFLKSTDIIIYVVAGGMGSLSGTFVSTGILTFLPEVLRNLNEGFYQYRIIIYALLLIFIMIFRSQGLMGRKEFSDLKIFKKRKKVVDDNVTINS
jgi:branched-chain amino acid transport system permease protein